MTKTELYNKYQKFCENNESCIEEYKSKNGNRIQVFKFSYVPEFDIIYKNSETFNNLRAFDCADMVIELLEN